jgi:hypothetical protein
MDRFHRTITAIKAGYLELRWNSGFKLPSPGKFFEDPLVPRG